MADAESTVLPHRGRPSGVKNKTTLAREQRESASAAGAAQREIRKREREDAERAAHGASTRAQTSGVQKKARSDPVLSDIPPRASTSSRMITTEEIRIALRAIAICKEDGEPDVFGRVQKITEIGQTKLYEIWENFCSRDGDKLPMSFVGATHIQRPSTVIKLFSGEIRKFVLERKLVHGQSVEIPDVLKFLKETFNFEIERNAMQRAMKKMGFLYGKKTKLMRNKVHNMNIVSPSVFLSHAYLCFCKKGHDCQNQEKNTCKASSFGRRRLLCERRKYAYSTSRIPIMM